jgi:hypothetical protein
MLRSLKGPLTVGVLFAGSLNASAASTILIRILNTSSASAEDLRGMQESADRVFNHSGIEIEWVSCAAGLRESAVCPEPENRAGKAVVFAHLVETPIVPERERNQTKRTLLGRANHPESSVALFYSTVFAIEKEAPRVVTKGQILGHALVHEIGHLLLGTDSHSGAGPMKSDLDLDDLYAIGKGSLLFTTRESAHLRKGIVSIAKGDHRPDAVSNSAETLGDL